MHASWVATEKDLKKWRKLYNDNKEKKFVVNRKTKNVCRQGIEPLSKQKIWRAIVSCQVTTQQHSGFGSKVEKFLKSRSFVLNKKEFGKYTENIEVIEREFKDAGLRRGKIIAGYLRDIYLMLEQGEWSELRDQLGTLVTKSSLEDERSVVLYLLSEEPERRGKTSKKYPGLGQKQSRNLIQTLGLSRYEIPIDSRVVKKLKELGANFIPSSSALNDESVYLFVQSGIQMVAKKLCIYPCELDACIFSSFEEGEWVIIE